MRAFELKEVREVYYHGSNDKLPVGTILTPGEDDYEENWGSNEWYRILEKYRPKEYRPHSWSVFMVKNPDDVDLAGGGTEWLFTVVPIGEVSKHDLNWNSEISMLIDDYYQVDKDEKLKQAAENYWNGVPHPNESVWEYLAPKARIVKVEKY